MTIIAQGEIYCRQIDALPEGLAEFTERNEAGDWIISHSESGNHHLLDGGATVMERTKDVPDGMRILYAIVDAPAQLRQDAAGNAHEAHDIAPGIFEMRIAREYDPFMQQARRVAD